MVESDLTGWKDCLQQRQLEPERVQIGRWFEVGGYYDEDGDDDGVRDSGVDCWYCFSHDFYNLKNVGRVTLTGLRGV